MLDYCTPWPAELTSAYRAAGYWAGLPLGEMLSSSADRYGGRTAVLDHTHRLSYRQLDSEVNRLANAFLGQGLAASDRVLVQLPNTVTFVTVCFALFRIGALPVFALPTYRRAEIEYLLAHSGALGYVIPDIHRGFDYRAFALSMLESVGTLRHVFVSGEPAELTGLGEIASAAEATPVRYRPDPADVAFFLLSGGTTALPKLIPRTHDDYVYQARVTASLCELGPDTAYLAVLPVEFNFTWGCPGVIGVLSTGGKVVLAADPSPRECFALIESEGITVTSVVPTIAHLWVEAAATTPLDLSSLRLIQVGSAPLHRELAERIPAVLRCQLQQVFGMAEGLLTFTRLDDDTETVLGTQGRPVSPADEIRVVDERGAPVPTGTEGELLARGPYTLRGYYRAGEHNAVAFTVDGFYRSGDLVRLTQDGNMVVAGRLKDVVVRGGDKISATEVESYLVRHPAVAQAAVVAMPDPVLGERTCAFVVCDTTPPSLLKIKRAMLADGVAEFKLPDRVEVVPRLPLTGLNKVDKKALARRAAELSGPAGRP